MATGYEKKYGNEMTASEILEEAISTSEMCMADHCMNCGACEQCEEEGFF
jgi:predicted RecB family nuclease